MVSNKCMDRNAKIIALFFMQYTFLIPVMQYVNPTAVVGVFSAGLMLMMLLTNSMKTINWRVAVLFGTLVLLFLVKVVVRQADVSTVAFVILFTLPAASLFLFPFSYSACVDWLVRIARVSFFVIAWVPFFFDFNYMRFGYGMLPVVILMYIDLLYRRKEKTGNARIRDTVMDAGILIASFAEMLVYGARGCLVALVLFVVMDRLLISKKHIVRNLILFILAAVILINIVPILDFAEEVTEKAGIESYTIAKFRMQITEGFESAASGRMRIYRKAIERFLNNPVFGGYINMNEEGGDYAHNLFLQVGEDFGAAAIAILLVFVGYAVYIIGRRQGVFDEKALLMLFFASSVGRLLFSSTLWRRPEFWMLVCMILTLKRNRKLNRIRYDVPDTGQESSSP